MVLAAACMRAARSGAYGNACECARQHIRSEGEVWRQCFIAGAIVSGRSPVVYGARQSFAHSCSSSIGTAGRSWVAMRRPVAGAAESSFAIDDSLVNGSLLSAQGWPARSSTALE